MNNDYIINRLERISKSMNIYNKKNEKMGFDRAEIVKYYDLLAEYLKLRLTLCDNVFNDYIMPYLIDSEKSEKAYQRVVKDIGWECKLLIERSDVDEILEKYRNHEDKEKVRDGIDELYCLLSEKLEQAELDKRYKDLFGEVSMLFSDGNTDSFGMIRNHLDYKFDLLYQSLESEGEKSE
jgi:hypothetical protein